MTKLIILLAMATMFLGLVTIILKTTCNFLIDSLVVLFGNTPERLR